MMPIAVSADGFSIAEHAVAYPQAIWRDFGPKRELAEELAALHATGELRRTAAHAFVATDEESVVVALTMGKDSLASIAVAQEMGLDLAAAIVYHPSLSADFRVRLPQAEALGTRLAMPVHAVRDDTMALAPPLSGPWVGSARTAAYCLLLLPVAAHHRARHLVLGNGFEFNAADSLQSPAGMAKLDAWIAAWTGGAVRVTSLIHALHPIACHKIVHAIRPELGLHQVSCRRAGRVRWCGECATCAENYVFVRAVGRDPATIGFTTAPRGEAAGLADLQSRFLAPVDAPVALPLADRSTAAARRLLERA